MTIELSGMTIEEKLRATEMLWDNICQSIPDLSSPSWHEDSIHFGRYHRLLSKRFPFAIYYRLEENEVRVYAVVDCRKNPAWVRKKLRLKGWRKKVKLNELDNVPF